MTRNVSAVSMVKWAT